MSWLKSLKSKSESKAKGKFRAPAYGDTEYDAPPEWQAAPEQVHAEGLYADATDEDYQSAEEFCLRNPPAPARLLSSESIERIRRLGCAAWQLDVPTSPRFRGVVLHHGGEKGEKGPSMGVIKVVTKDDCQDVCILSDLPILAGLYDTRGRPGVYYEVKILRMDGVIALGECHPPANHRHHPCLVYRVSSTAHTMIFCRNGIPTLP